MKGKPIDIQLNMVSLDAQRSDMGDIAALSESIQKCGLLHPIIVDANNRIIAGRRRVQACRLLQWTTIPAIRREDLDAVKTLMVTRDENDQRKNLSKSEAAKLFTAIKAKEEAAAKDRMKKGRTGESGASGSAADKAAAAVGMSRQTAERAAAVVEAAEKNPALAPVVEEMDRTGNVSAAARAVEEPEQPEPEDDGPVDMLGQPIVDDAIAAAFEVGKELAVLRTRIRGLKTELTRALEELGLDGISQSITQIAQDFRNILNVVECYMPHCQVPAGSGFHRDIEKRGWINEGTFEKLPAAKQAELRGEF